MRRLLLCSLLAASAFGQTIVGVPNSTTSGSNNSGGSGTVTSVGLTLPVSVFTVTGSPVTTSGVLAGTLNVQAANQVFAGPTTGASAAPAFRTLVAADLPSGSGTVTSVSGAGGVTVTSPTTTPVVTCATAAVGTPGCAQPDGTSISAASGVLMASTAGTWNITQFGAAPCTLANCSTGPDSSTAFAAAATACGAAAHGGIIYVPSGVWEFAQYIWHDNCTLWGAGKQGPGTTKLFQTPNSNEDFIISAGTGYLSAPTRVQTWSTGNSGGTGQTNGGGFRDLLIDGNGINQSGAGPYHGIVGYAATYAIKDTRVVNTKGPCVSLDYNNAAGLNTQGSWAAFIDDLVTQYCGEDINGGGVTLANSHCFEIGGPTDLVITNFLGSSCSGDTLFLGHNIGDLYLTGHCYSPTLNCIEGEAYGVKGFMEVEGAPSGQTNINLLNAKWLMQLDIFRATPGSTASGMTFGQASTATAHCNSFFQTVPGACTGGAAGIAVGAFGNNLQLTTAGFTSSDLVFTAFENSNVINIVADHSASSGGTGGTIWGAAPNSTDIVITPPPIGSTCNNFFEVCGGIQMGPFQVMQGTTTTLNGATAGTIACSEPFTGVVYRYVTCNTTNLNGATTASYTFPKAFAHVPLVSATSGITASALSATAVTITGTAVAGFITFTGSN